MTPRVIDWHVRPAFDLEMAIAEFKRALPGWWYSVCECQVSSDASCAPTVESPHHKLIALDPRFDSGFHADLPQPATLADALRQTMRSALVAINEATAKGRTDMLKAEQRWHRSRDAMDSSTYNGRMRTNAALAEVRRLAELLGLSS